MVRIFPQGDEVENQIVKFALILRKQGFRVSFHPLAEIVKLSEVDLCSDF
jgi:uroporphyrinogen-III synthase